MLTLTIKKKWFDMIASGEKKEEYRDIKPYYTSRLLPLFGLFWIDDRLVKGKGAVHDAVPIIFRNGYRADSPKIKAICSIRTGYGKQEWGAEHGVMYYVLHIKEVRKVENR